MSVTVPAPGGPVAPVLDKHGLPPYVDPFRQRGRTVLLVLVWVAAVLGVAAAIALSVLTAREASGLILLYALIPAATLVAGFIWLDRYEPEPRRYVLAAFVWGAAVSTSGALAGQLLVARIWDPSDEVMATFVAPLTEEPAKCLFLVLTFLRLRRVVDGFVDAIVYAGVVGLGFAFLENVGYLSVAYDGIPNPEGPELDGIGGATATFVVRGVFSPFAHPLFMTSFAAALAWALVLRSWWLKVPVLLAGLLGSMALHGIWNGGVSYGGPLGFVAAYLFLACVLAGLVTAAILARVRQGRRLRAALTHMAGRGWLHRDEVPFLGTFALRARAVAFARTQGPPTAQAAFRRYQRLAVRAAFLYDGVMRGRPKPYAVQQVDALRWAMVQVKPFVRLPPALRPVLPPWGPPPGWGPPPAWAPPPGHGPADGAGAASSARTRPLH